MALFGESELADYGGVESSAGSWGAVDQGLSVLQRAGNVVTDFARTYGGFQSTQAAIANQRTAADIARYNAQAERDIAKAVADRNVALARGTASSAGMLPLIILAALGYVVIKAAK